MNIFCAISESGPNAKYYTKGNYTKFREGPSKKQILASNLMVFFCEAVSCLIQKVFKWFPLYMGGLSLWYQKFLKFSYTVNSPQWLLENHPLCSSLTLFPVMTHIPKDLDFHKDSWDLRDYHQEKRSLPVFKNQQTKWKDNRYPLLFFVLTRVIGAFLTQGLKHWIYPFKQSKVDTTNKRTFWKSTSGHGNWVQQPQEEAHCCGWMFLVQWSAVKWLTVLAFKWS